MGQRRHKRRAKQHPAQSRRDEVRERLTIRRDLIIPAISWAAAVSIIGWAATFGAPANSLVAYVLGAALIIAMLGCMHFLVMRVLPVSRSRRRRAPGISERGIAYGVSPRGLYGGAGRIDIHLDDSKND